MPDLPTTLQQYLLERLENHPSRLELVMMMADIATIGKLISAQTNRIGLTGVRGMAGSANKTGDDQAKLDVYTNDLCKQYLSNTGLFAAMASEEEETAVDLKNPNGKYVIAFDPLDGSGNIDVNVSIGTIFSVLPKLKDVPAGSDKQFFQPAKDQVLAGYIFYGSSTVLVFSWGDGVHEFTLDQDLGEFFLSNDHMKIPDKLPYYSANEAYDNPESMGPRDRAYLEKLKGLSGTQRWVGAFAADVHRNLIKGGVTFYPAVDSKGKSQYRPKLRLNYEVKPLAFLVAQAGGAASTGTEDLLTLQPTELHQRVPVIIGNKKEVNMYKEVT